MRRPRFGLTTQIMTGVIGGVFLGLLVGEPAGSLRILGTAFVGLLQMTVLPYMVCALISGIGSLTTGQARRLAIRGGTVMVLIWLAPLTLVVVLSQAYPPMNAGSFFSAAFTETPASVDFLSLYIPSNPFRSLANSFVPAVVVFSLVLGIAMIGVPGKERLLDPLSAMVTALGAVNRLIVRLTPIGVFGMAANAAGMMTVDQLGRLQGYFILYIIGALILGLWLLPMVVVSLTPLRYRDLLGPSRDAIVTAIVIDNVFVVLPQLIAGVQRSLEQSGIEGEEMQFTSEVALPVAFTFPSTGRLLSLLFLPFSAWFLGDRLGAQDFALLFTSAVPANFGSAAIAIPFLLDLMHLPADMFQLFMVSGIVVGRFGTLVAVIHLLTFTALTSCAMSGRLRPNPKRAVVYGTITAGLVIGSTIGTRLYLGRGIDEQYGKEAVVLAMQVLEDSAPHIVEEELTPNPEPPLPDESPIDRIRRRGVVRIGFRLEALPFSFRNTNGDLVGLDVELMHRFAREFGAELEFVPFRSTEAMHQGFTEDHFDLAIGGLAYQPDPRGRIRFSRPYVHLTPALVVADHRRDEFSDLRDVRKRSDLRFAGVLSPYTERVVRDVLPNAQIVHIESPWEFFPADRPPADALVTCAEVGSAFTLIYPAFSVVKLTETPVAWPVGFVFPYGSDILRQTMDDWLELKRGDATITKAYDHWILGEKAEDQDPRWCILRDVLGWWD